MKNKKDKILLLGGSGNLGSSIIKSKIFKNLYAPNKKILNIEDSKSIAKILNRMNIKTIINCAAIARIKECEANPSKAIKVNVDGTFNLVKEVLKKKNNLRFIHISTDAVYKSTSGNYSEKSELWPHNNYDWTKMTSEYLVKFLKNYVIIRTRFYNKDKIKYKKSANDIFTSKMEVNELVDSIKLLLYSNFIGIVNVGSKRQSDYQNYKKHKKDIMPTKRIKLIKKLKFFMAKDASMNLNLFNKLKKNG